MFNPWKRQWQTTPWRMLPSTSARISRSLTDSTDIIIIHLPSYLHVVPSLLCVYIHLLSSDWERHLWLLNISINLPCVYLCLSSRDIFIFSVWVFSFIFMLSVLQYFPFPHGLSFPSSFCKNKRASYHLTAHLLLLLKLLGQQVVQNVLEPLAKGVILYVSNLQFLLLTSVPHIRQLLLEHFYLGPDARCKTKVTY